MTDATLPPAPPGPAPIDRPTPTDLRLDRRVVPYWWLAGLTSTAILAGLIVGVAVVFRRELIARGYWDSLFWTATALLSLRATWAIIAPPWSWRRWRWRIDPELLLLRWGIISHHERAIPISRLQHVDLTRGPIERLFGLTTVVVHTAGTESSSFRLPGLADIDARAVRDRILATRGDDVV